MSASARLLRDGRQLHLQHGPIDLIIDADGDSAEGLESVALYSTESAKSRAFTLATHRFETVLQELVDELALLRSRTNPDRCHMQGRVACRMWESARQIPAEIFTTPMISVAGSVADEILSCMKQESGLSRISVNNGGDIALYVGPQQNYQLGIVANPIDARVNATIELTNAMAIGGVATSGRHGRSLSLGIADSVTVLAVNAATADAAATVIANGVTLRGCDAIQRCPATDLDPDSDLGSTRVTTDVGYLSPEQINTALDSGLAVADDLRTRRIIVSAWLYLRDHHRTTDVRSSSGYL